MQRRHFEALAEAVRSVRLAHPEPEAGPIIEDMERNLMAAIRRFNSNFDSGRFRDACQVSTTYRDKSRGRNSAA